MDFLRNIIALFFCVLIIMNVILIAKSYLNPDKVPSVLGVSPVVVVSGSMQESIPVGSLIFIKDIQAENLKVGDIITYLKDEIAVTHRINSIEKIGNSFEFTTKGDENDSVDNFKVLEEEIQGKYILHIEKLGLLILFLQTPTGILLCIVLPLCLITLFEINKKNKKNIQSQKEIETLKEELNKIKKDNENE